MSQFTNETIDLDLLPKYEDTQLTAPDPKYWNVIAINILLFLAFLGSTLTLFLIFNEQAKNHLFLWIGLFLLLAALLFLIYRASFKRRGFALREKDLIYKSGVIVETTTIIPLNRIQHIALNEGLFSRMYKLSTLQLFTASGSSGNIHIAGIEVEKARAIKEALLSRLDLSETSSKI